MLIDWLIFLAANLPKCSASRVYAFLAVSPTLHPCLYQYIFFINVFLYVLIDEIEWLDYFLANFLKMWKYHG